MTLEYFIRLAGVAQICLVLGSAFIPKCLNWQNAMGSANRLTRQMFWTYACYILAMHLFFGAISTFAADSLMTGDILAVALSALMWLWWTIRIILQFFCFDRTCIPHTRFNVLAECVLVLLFVFLAVVYGIVLWRNVL